jgi:hypothetical protein
MKVRDVLTSAAVCVGLGALLSSLDGCLRRRRPRSRFAGGQEILRRCHFAEQCAHRACRG